MGLAWESMLAGACSLSIALLFYFLSACGGAAAVRRAGHKWAARGGWCRVGVDRQVSKDVYRGVNGVGVEKTYGHVDGIMDSCARVSVKGKIRWGGGGEAVTGGPGPVEGI